MRNGNFIVCFIFSILITLGIITFKEIDVSASSITLDELHSEFAANTAVTKSDGYWDARLTSLGFNFVRQHQFYSQYNSHMYTYVITDKKMKHYGSSVVGSFDSSKCIRMVVKKFDDGTEYVGGFGFSEDRYFLNLIGYDIVYETAYNCPDGLENADSSWINETLSDIDVSDVNTYPVGHIEFLNPANGSEIALNYSKSKGYYVRNCKIVGKIPFDSEVEISETDYIKMLKSSLMLSFGKIDNNGNVVEVAENKVTNENGFLVNNFNLKTYGNVLNWRTNGYVTFECTFDEYLTRAGDTVFDFKIKVPNEFKKVLMFFDYDYSIYDVSTSFSIKEYVDLNGDGIDDNTGETIPNDYFNVSDSSSDWDDMDLMQKIEYLFTSIPNMLSRIFDSIINSIKYAFQCLGVVVSSGSELGGIFNNLFGIFPSPIPELVTLCIFVIPFIALFSWIKK